MDGCRNLAKKGEWVTVAEDGAGLTSPPLVSLEQMNGFSDSHGKVLLSVRVYTGRAL